MKAEKCYLEKKWALTLSSICVSQSQHMVSASRRFHLSDSDSDSDSDFVYYTLRDSDSDSDSDTRIRTDKTPKDGQTRHKSCERRSWISQGQIEAEGTEEGSGEPV